MGSPADNISFFDPETNDCPYPAYQRLRDEAPVWKDPVTGMYTVTRYEDVRAILLDKERFSNEQSSGNAYSEEAANAVKEAASAIESEDPERARQMLAAMVQERELQQLYEEKGWPPASTLDGLDEPRHGQLRRMFDPSFKPAKIAELDPFVEALAHRLLDGFVDQGRCEFVAQYAIPLPLITIGHVMGVPESQMAKIKTWTDAFAQRLGLMQTPEERLWSAEQEIEFQHFFQPIYERLREQPDDTMLSALVNTEIPEWGRTLTDAELHSEMMIDFMVGGSETTTNALSGGVLLLIRNPAVWDRVASDLDHYLPAFLEEVLRLESPVQMLLRQAKVDVELHGVTIPAGALVSLRYGAANRDERYDCPAEIDLDRKQPRSHLAFGVGAHHCLGAPLARRELYYGFRAIFERLEDLRFVEGANDFSYQPNYFLRSLKKLHIEFKRKGA